MSPDKNNPKSGALWLGRAIAALLLVATEQAWASVTVTLTAPAGGSVYTSSLNITLTADASAGQGFTLSKVEFFSGTSLIGTDFSAPYGVTWAGAPLGQHSLTAKATAIKKNNPDQTATSLAVNITVKALLHYVHVDHLNTPRLVANVQGQTVWRWDQQEPFGVNVADENPSSLGTFEFPLRYPGQYFDKETNNHYNYFRDYDPAIGRYVQSDPVGLGGGLNTFAYVLGDPLSLVDVEGLMSDVQCCQISRSLNQHIDPSTGQIDTGWPVCCEGRKVGCANIGSVGLDTPIGMGVVRSCVVEHERDHFPILETCDCSISGVKRLNARPGVDVDADECRAYKRTITCLRRGVPKCGQDKKCISDIQHAIRASKERRNFHCRGR